MEAVKDQPNQDHLVTLPTETLDSIFAEVKERMREATESHSNQRAHDLSMGDGDSCYIASNSDFDALVEHFRDAIHRLQQTCSQDAVVFASASRTPSSTSSGMPSTVPKPRQLMGPTAIDPATTISVSEAFFPPVVSDQVRAAPRKNSTTATIVSGDNITEITWLGNQSTQTEDPSDRSGSLVGATAVQDTSGSRVTNGPLDPGSRAEQSPSLLARLRKKSVRFGQLEGPPANGGYHNDNYKPRRESSLFRMRAILDRLEPSRPKQDAAIFTAMTGARPTQPTHDLYTERPEFSRLSCSEDGRQHRCTQHDSLPTSPG